MGSSGDWMKDYNGLVKLADDINGMISDRSSMAALGPESQRFSSDIRRKITILGTKLDTLESDNSRLPGKQQM